MGEQQTLSNIGYYNLAPGKLATVVTSLEMVAKANNTPKPPCVAVDLQIWTMVDVTAYRALFKHVGENWLWCARLQIADEALSAIVNDPRVDVYAVMHDGMACGLLELDYRQPMTCEIAYFGLSNRLIGRGAGGWLMCQAIERAWSHDIRRMWVHTCTLDHPTALGFYQRFGFNPFKQQIEIMDDPRLHGILPPNAAPHIPLMN